VEFLRIEQGGNSGEESGGHEDESDEDELAKWESDQIRKGVSSQRVIQPTSSIAAHVRERLLIQVTQMQEELHATILHYGRHFGRHIEKVNLDDEEDDMEVDMDVEIVEPMAAEAVKQPMPNFSSTSSITVASVLENVKGRLIDRRQQLGATEYELSKADGNLEENMTMMQRLGEGYPQLQERYQMFQELRLYSVDLLECLNAKVGTAGFSSKLLKSLSYSDPGD
jgi:hypothetical protein